MSVPQGRILPSGPGIPGGSPLSSIEDCLDLVDLLSITTPLPPSTDKDDVESFTDVHIHRSGAGRATGVMVGGGCRTGGGAVQAERH